MGTQGSTLEGDRTDTENPFRAQVVDIFNDILDKIERLDSRDLRSVMEGLGLRDLDGENLSEADLSGQDLSGLSFRGVSFAKADCSRTNFSGCDLSGANFAGAKVARACFVGAVLDGTVGLPRTVASSKPREQASKPRERAERGARSAVLYEHVFIARQDLAQAQVDALTDTAARIIEEAGGKVVKTESWGLRSLAYRIAKNRKGHYVMLDFEAPPAAVAELERQTQINEDVIRYMTVRVEQHERGPSAMMARGERSKAPESEDGSGARQRVRFRGENA